LITLISLATILGLGECGINFPVFSSLSPNRVLFCLGSFFPYPGNFELHKHKFFSPFFVQPYIP